MSSKSKLIAAAAALSMVVPMAAPLAAHAQYSTQAYDGYCYARKSDAQKNGAILGAVIGGLAGSQVSKNERGLGAVGGAVAGGVIGSQIGKSSVKCYNGAYYSYGGHYYTPPAAPDGYEVHYFKERPAQGDYYDRVYDSPPSGYASDDRYSNGGGYNDNRYNNDDRYNRRQDGFMDDRGNFYPGQPRAYGWQDDRGVWHTGTITYGYRDGRGDWHTTNTQGSGYSNR
jgi:hypothetical protein